MSHGYVYEMEPFLLSVCVALSACSMTPENPSETSEIFSGLNEDLEEKPLEVLYHGGNPLTPEDTLSKVLIETSEKSRYAQLVKPKCVQL